MRTRKIKNPTSIKNLKRSSIFDNLNDDFSVPTINAETGQWEYLNQDGLSREDYVALASDEANQYDSIGAVYQRADRIITGQTELGVTVTMSKEMKEPSVTDGKDIIINGNFIGELNDDMIIALNGINYHELAHVLFSPRAGSGLGRWVMDNKSLKAFNLLEEGRIERLLTTQYPTTAINLEAMTSQILLDTDKIGDQFPTLTGRTYMPLDIRQAVADKFIADYGLAVAQEVHSIVHAYRTLAFPDDFDKAKELIGRMTNLIGQDDTPEGQKPLWGDVHGDRPVPERGRPKSGKEQGKLQDRAQDNPTEKLDNPEFGTGAGTKPSAEYEGEDRKLSEAEATIAKKLEDRLTAIKSDKRIKRDLSETRKAILGNTDVSVKLPIQKCGEITPSPSAINYARKFGRELERIVRDQDPRWDTHLPSGRLNIQRTMNPDVNSINEAFDVWNTGNDNTEIEACVLLDNSGSMWGLMRTVCEQAWIIKRGIESINGSVSVYNFSSDSKQVYHSDERAKPNALRFVQANGWTNPYRGLVEAERVMKATDKPNKIMFIVTDGQWENATECNAIIKRMKDSGVIVAVVYLSNGLEGIQEYMRLAKQGDEQARVFINSLNHGADIFKAVSEPKHTLELANDIVKSTITNNRKRVA